MNWDAFAAAPARWKSYVMKINHHLTGQDEQFSADIYAKEDTVEKIKLFLNTISGRNGELTTSSKKTYVSALSTYLDIAHIDNKPYKALITEFANQIKKTPVVNAFTASTEPVSSDDLLYAINGTKVHYNIKLLASILFYGYRKQLRLVDVCSTRHDINNGTDHYLDTTTGVWTLYNKTNTLPVKITICPELLDLINQNKGPVWVTGGSGNKVTTNSLSVMFKHMFKYPYISVAKMINPSDTDSSVEESPAPIEEITQSPPTVDVDVDVVDVVDVVDIVDGGFQIKSENTVPIPPQETLLSTPTEKVKITVKPKNEKNVRSPRYEWSYFRRQSADDIHIQRVQQLMDMIAHNHEYFYHDLVDTEQGVTLVEAKLKNITSINTQMNYCNSLCKFLELTLAKHYSDYTLLRDKIALALHQHNANRTVTPYEDIIPRLQYILTSSASTDLKIMSMLLISIQDYTQMNTGALRFSDVTNTRLTDDGEHHYLDLQSKTWLLRQGFTKNKQTRTATISDSFKEYILSLKIDNTSGLICRSGKTHNLSKEFHKCIGVNFSAVRASYVTFLDGACDDVETIKQICNNQGHKLTTALESYRRQLTPDDDH